MGHNTVVHPAGSVWDLGLNVGCTTCCCRSWSLRAEFHLWDLVGGIGSLEMGCFGGNGSAMLQRMGVAWLVSERLESTSLKVSLTL